jgi:hypothetical protein
MTRTTDDDYIMEDEIVCAGSGGVGMPGDGYIDAPTGVVDV